MNKKIAIAMAALMVAALAAPAVIADTASYSATVQSGQSTTTTTNSGAFGNIVKGNSKTLTSSLTLNNVGDVAATVNAKFTTFASGTYGLTNGTNVIGGSNFTLGKTGSLIALSNANTDTSLTPANNVPAAGSVNYDANLNVPGTQAAAAYSGTVQLTFANA
jgi:hypothetical protein